MTFFHNLMGTQNFSTCELCVETRQKITAKLRWFMPQRLELIVGPKYKLSSRVLWQ